MWSAPRNLSVAVVVGLAAGAGIDLIAEPFYAAYLRAAGSVHPMRA